MYDNVGEKIKALAEGAAAVGIIASLIVGIYFMFIELVFLGIIIALVGSASSWLSSIVLYGFGTLIVDVGRIANGEVNTTNAKKTTSVNAVQSSSMSNWSGRGVQKNIPGGWVCTKCGKSNFSYTGTCACGNQKD